jgi:integrase
MSLANGDDAKTLQDALGHYSAAFTLDVYGHVTQKMKRDSADRMQDFITSLEKSERDQI